MSLLNSDLNFHEECEKKFEKTIESLQIQKQTSNQLKKENQMLLNTVELFEKAMESIKSEFNQL